MDHPHLFYWLAALHSSGMGPRQMKRGLDVFPTIKALFTASREELQAKGFTPKWIDALKQPNAQLIDSDMKWAQAPNHHLICFDDDDYPVLLKEIADPPLVLYVKGNRKALEQKQLAIVGSRHATQAGLCNAEQFAYCLAEKGFAITSGLALGVDGASHRGALRAKGVTIGVAGTGLNHLYPSRHEALIEDMIQSQGAVLSELPLQTPPRATNFPRRNRIISGLSRGVLVVEAALKSGSLITARLALEQGREVFAIPGSIHHPLARGCHALIRQGAKLVETADDILEEMGFFQTRYLLTCDSPDPVAPTLPLPTHLSPENEQFLAQIGYEVTPVDLITLRCGLTAAQVSSMLLTLELEGYIQSVSGGYIRTARQL